MKRLFWFAHGRRKRIVESDFGLELPGVRRLVAVLFTRELCSDHAGWHGAAEDERQDKDVHRGSPSSKYRDLQVRR
jgi:hypothetical protein